MLPSAASDNIQMKWCWWWCWDHAKFCLLIVFLSNSCLAARCWSPCVVLNFAESFRAEPEKKTKLMSLSALLLNSFPTKEASKISCQSQFPVENKSLQGSMSCLLHCGYNPVVKSTKKFKPEVQSIWSLSPLVEFAGQRKRGKQSNTLQQDLSRDIKTTGYISMQLW